MRRRIGHVMCGIVGLRESDERSPDEALLRRMAATLVHRGPDGEGYWTSGPVGFGHRRLSIIDLKGSHQPMHAGPLHVCFNGEIFNYKALRRELAGSGFEFRTRGDTEILLALHSAAGPVGVKRLQGQFAYALWDERTQQLWLHRDRLGILPLYYHFEAGRLAFASEIKAVLEALSERELDEDSLGDYLAYRSVPWPNTLFRGVYKLAPGHTLRLDPDGDMHIEPYWQLPTAAAAARVDVPATVQRVETALLDAVSSQMVADVPVGAYLSGGVDSSLIVALMAKASGGSRVETFSAGFEDPRYDELPYAREVSQALSTRHHEVVVRPRDFQELWHRLTWHRDAPISEPADLAIFRLAKLARSTVKVLLSGEGSDELFAGYPKYAWARPAALADAVPPSLRQRIFGGLERLLPAVAAKPRIMLRAMSAGTEADRFQAWFAPFTRYERDALLPDAGREGHLDIWRRATGDVVQRMLYVDCHTWLVDNLLERMDRMAMAASMESRPPFLDHRLVELAFSLPSSLKLRRHSTKWVVKEVARRWLPPKIVDRRKVGFRVPLDLWFRSDLREMTRDLLLSSDSFVAGRLARRPVERLLDDHKQGRRDEEIRIWTLLCLEIWHQVFFRKQGIPRRTAA